MDFYELRLAARVLARRPLFTAVAAVTIALGLGAVTAITSFAKAVFFDPLPYRQPERLVSVATAFPERGVERQSISYPDYLDWRDQSSLDDQSSSLEGLVAYSAGESLVFQGEDRAELLGAELVSRGYFSLLGVDLALGRSFTAEEAVIGAERVVILGHDFWRRQFNTNPTAIGRTIELNDADYRIVGVARDGFRGLGDGAELWLPITEAARLYSPRILENRRLRVMSCFGRLRDGVSIDQARTELELIARRLAETYPESNEGAEVAVRQLAEEYFAEHRRGVFLLGLGALLVLFLACLNVANLLLVGAARRGKEVALRRALGAGDRQILRQRLLESALLTLIGGFLGVLLAAWGTGALLAASSLGLVSSVRVDIDLGVLAVGLLVAVVAAAVLALVSALAVRPSSLAAALRVSGDGADIGRGRLQRGLILIEIAVALVLVVGAAQMLSGYRHLQNTDLGFDPDGVLALEVFMGGERYGRASTIFSLGEAVLDRLRGLPGVESVSLTSPAIVPDALSYLTLVVEGREGDADGGVVRTHPHRVLPGYFRTLSVPILAGRDFTEQDDASTPGVVIVSEAMAEGLWPGEQALGQRLRFNLPAYADRWMEVIGVVGDAKQRGLLYDSDSPDVYLAFRQLPGQRLGYVVRGAADPASLIPAVRDTLRDLDPHLPVDTLETLESRLAADLAQPGFRVRLISLFAAVALALAVIGLYGVMANSVIQRRRELGIRMAVGADRGRVLRLVLWEGARLALLGILLGIDGVFAATRLVAAFLYGIPPNDPTLLAVLALLLLLTSLFATLVPAWRASRVDPITILRQE
ncbi:MAG: ABC transporter permease [Acidobacteriota bacterium]